jgi:fatty acid desaturase
MCNGTTVVFDSDAFDRDIKAARDSTKPSAAEDDAHMKRIERWTMVLGVVGTALCLRGSICPIAMLCLGFHRYAKFAILAHHSLHGGWGNQVRGSFAKGLYRRIIDWLDWIHPAAWVAEHNKLHHYYLNEDLDPDFVERNMELLHEMKVPMVFKYLVVIVMSSLWKWGYYASNTLKLLHEHMPGAPSKQELERPIVMANLFGLALLPAKIWHRWLAIDFIGRVMLPPFLVNYVLISVIGGLIHGSRMYHGLVPFCWITFLNIVGAEAFNNVHAFATIVTNHAGSDLWHFDSSCKADSAEFIMRAILGSTAYPAGNDYIDYFHGYLNYQAEHHSFPALTPLHYQRLHPRFKAVCATYGVPMVQENIWIRSCKTVQVAVGAAKHKRMSGPACTQPELWMIKNKAA